MAAEQSQQTLIDEVSQLKSGLSIAEHSQQSCEDENKKLLTDNLKLLHRQDQLEMGIRDLQTDMTSKEEQIVQLIAERDELQSEVSQLGVTALQPIVSPSGAVLKVIPFELDNEWADTGDCDEVGPSALVNTGSVCPHVFTGGAISTN